jgi:hypothetical protein
MEKCCEKEYNGGTAGGKGRPYMGSQRVKLTAPTDLGTVCENWPGANHAPAVPHSIPRYHSNSPAAYTTGMPPACSAACSACGWPKSRS